VTLFFISFVYRYLTKEKDSFLLQEKIQQNSQSNNPIVIKAEKTNITFDDIVGVDDIKDELIMIVDFLNSPQKYLKHRVSLPKGVLLVGPPGVGKTMIAKAVANEASSPFYYQSAASFVELYVGAGAKKVRELFTTARANSPSIIFIDELDAIGKSRASSGNDEREATLNELLTQMDGFLSDGKNSIIVIAATNAPELLDDALLRPGRFDRKLILSLPDKYSREIVIKKELYDRKFDFDISNLSYATVGFSSAGLVAMINEAVLNMIKRGDETITQTDIDVAKTNIEFGKKECTVMTDKEKDILMTYQATKAYISRQKIKLLQEGVIFESIVFPSKAKLQTQIANLLSGLVGLEVILGEQYIVFESEIKKANKIAFDIVNRYHLGFFTPDEIVKNIKESLAIDIKANQEKIAKLKDELLKYEVANGDKI